MDLKERGRKSFVLPLILTLSVLTVVLFLVSIILTFFSPTATFKTEIITTSRDSGWYALLVLKTKLEKEWNHFEKPYSFIYNEDTKAIDVEINKKNEATLREYLEKDVLGRDIENILSIMNETEEIGETLKFLEVESQEKSLKENLIEIRKNHLEEVLREGIIRE